MAARAGQATPDVVITRHNASDDGDLALSTSDFQNHNLLRPYIDIYRVPLSTKLFRGTLQRIRSKLDFYSFNLTILLSYDLTSIINILILAVSCCVVSSDTSFELTITTSIICQSYT